MSPYSIEHFPDEMGSEVALEQLRKNLGVGIGSMDALKQTVMLLSLFPGSKNRITKGFRGMARNVRYEECRSALLQCE